MQQGKGPKQVRPLVRERPATCLGLARVRLPSLRRSDRIRLLLFSLHRWAWLITQPPVREPFADAGLPRTALQTAPVDRRRVKIVPVLEMDNRLLPAPAWQIEVSCSRV